jgi:hypothetical protein
VNSALMTSSMILRMRCWLSRLSWSTPNTLRAARRALLRPIMFAAMSVSVSNTFRKA